jgi:hypothetical protein
LFHFLYSIETYIFKKDGFFTSENEAVFLFCYQLSAISYQLSAISYQLSAISYQQSAISFQLSLQMRRFANTQIRK